MSKGQSLDSSYQLLAAKIKSWNGLAWFVVAGRIVLVVLVVWIFWLLFNRLQKDEQKVDSLHIQLEQEKRETERLLSLLSQRGVAMPVPEDELHAGARQELDIPHPHIVDFVKEARQVGLKDEHIREQLGKAGWNETEILRAFNAMV